MTSPLSVIVAIMLATILVWWGWTALANRVRHYIVCLIGNKKYDLVVIPASRLPSLTSWSGELVRTSRVLAGKLGTNDIPNGLTASVANEIVKLQFCGALPFETVALVTESFEVAGGGVSIIKVVRGGKLADQLLDPHGVEGLLSQKHIGFAFLTPLANDKQQRLRPAMS